MSGLDRIAVKVLAEPPDAQPAMCDAIVTELAALLDQLIQTGKPGSIDLRRMPLGPSDQESLAAFLGSGEVRATINALGTTQVRETSYPGVWWVSHYGTDEALAAEFIEVTTCPDILSADPFDLAAGRERLAREKGLYQSARSSGAITATEQLR